MKNYPKVELYHGDCFEISRKLISDGVLFDAVLTDPPYGIMKGMDTNAGKDANGRYIVVQKHEWDTALPVPEMFDLISGLTKPKANVLLFAQEPYTARLITARHSRVKFCQRLHWLKPHISNPFNCRRAAKNVVEDILLFASRPQASRGTIKTFNLWRSGARHIKNVFAYPQDRYTPGCCQSYHPTQKPQCLLEDLIKTYTNPGDRILDFTMGSGSTGVACLRTGRSFVGIERDEMYFQVARKRISECLKDL